MNVVFYDRKGKAKKGPDTGDKVAIGLVGASAAVAYAANKKPKTKTKPKGLKAPTAKSLNKVEGRLLNTHKFMEEVAIRDSMNTGKVKPTLGYNPRTGRMEKEPAFNQKRLNQINTSYLSGKPQANTSMDQKIAKHGNRMRRIGASITSPKNKAIRTMGKILSVAKAGSVLGAISYAFSSTPVGDATMDGKKYKYDIPKLPKLKR